MRTEREECPIDDNVTGHQLTEQVVAFYHCRLMEHEPALEFLKAHGIHNEEAITSLCIGFADRTLGVQLPSKQVAAGKRIRTSLTDIGIFRESGHAHFNGCLTVPIRDSQGSIIQIYGRRIDARSPKIIKDLYLAGGTDCLFNPQAFNGGSIILTDSVLNCLSFISHGHDSATCVLSGNVTCSALMDTLSQSEATKVYLAFESTEDGERMLHAAHKAFMKLGVSTYHVRFPWGMDANQTLVAKGPEYLAQCVQTAPWLGSGAKAAPKPGIQQNSSEPTLRKAGEHYTCMLGDCTFRITGLERNSTPDVLKITLRIDFEGTQHTDQLDLFKDKDRRRFVDRAHEELRLPKPQIKRDMGQLLLMLETEQQTRTQEPEVKAPVPTDADKNAAMALLRSPNLITEIATHFEQAGLVGEATNKIAAFLAMLSSKLPKPLGLVIQSSSASGKSTLMDKVLDFFPPEDQLRYSAITGQSLFYQQDMAHKILAISEEIGFEKAAGTLKLLQSQGHLSISTTSKDPKSGRLKSISYHVQGPVALVFTTTSIELDEELLNRCLVLTTDESPEQTQRIHALQREARSLEGILAREACSHAQRTLHDAMRLIRPVRIYNPYASQLTFTHARTRTRRDHEKYLTLIDTIALLHQHQRQTITHEVSSTAGDRMGAQAQIELLPVTLEDIQLANHIAAEVLGRSMDELPPQTRRMLDHAKALVRAKMKRDGLEQREALFTRRELREHSAASPMQVRRHLERLIELEYLQARGGSNGVAMSYELLVDSTQDPPCPQIGLIDVQTLKTP